VKGKKANKRHVKGEKTGTGRQLHQMDAKNNRKNRRRARKRHCQRPDLRGGDAPTVGRKQTRNIQPIHFTASRLQRLREDILP